jgi:SWI/SNF-related matrix-associated actin-dependent regulator 1 of chromatin subfamily A
VILKPFQHAGVDFLVRRTRALLADEPGVGKTPQLICAAKRIGAETGVVVCPSIAMEHWKREMKKWDLQQPRHRFAIVPWHRADDYAVDETFDVLIVDESHYGKNPLAQRTKAVFGKGGLAYYARRIWCASGTPAPNNAAELWPMMYTFGVTKLDPEAFKHRYCIVSEDGKVRGNREENLPELRAMLKSFSLRRRKSDVLPELGELDIQEFYVEPSAECAGIADVGHAGEAALRAALADKSADEILTFLAGDKEFATVRRYSALLKVPAVADLICDEIQEGTLGKVVVFGYHVEPMHALREGLYGRGVKSLLITGKENDRERRERDARIEHWKTAKDVPVLIASINVAATALDFTAAHQGIMLELDWVPGNNLQAMQRMHRHGQIMPVTVRVAIGTAVDEVISDVLIRKTRDLAEIFS